MKYVVYGKETCPYCILAKELLEQHDLECEYIDVSQDEEARAWLKKKGYRTVPQIQVKEDKGWGVYEYIHIGGFSDLQEHLKRRQSA